MGDVRLRQFRLHDRRPHRGLQRLLRVRRRGQRGLGHLRLDRRAVPLLRGGDADRAAAGRLGRRACRQEGHARGLDDRVHRRHGGARVVPRRRGGVGGGVDRRLQRRLLDGREPRGGIPARALASRGARQGLGMGLEPRLLRRHPRARPLARLGDVRAGARIDGHGCRAGHDDHHRGDLRHRGPADIPVAARARRARGDTRHARGDGAADADRAFGAQLRRPAARLRVRRVLPGGRGDGDRARGHLCRAGDGASRPGTPSCWCWW